MCLCVSCIFPFRLPIKHVKSHASAHAVYVRFIVSNSMKIIQRVSEEKAYV